MARRFKYISSGIEVFFKVMWGFLKDIIKEMEAFEYKCEAFIKITRLFEDIFREIEGFN
jgi:hypothetical protein